MSGNLPASLALMEAYACRLGKSKQLGCGTEPDIPTGQHPRDV